MEPHDEFKDHYEVENLTILSVSTFKNGAILTFFKKENMPFNTGAFWSSEG